MVLPEEPRQLRSMNRTYRNLAQIELLSSILPKHRSVGSLEILLPRRSGSFGLHAFFGQNYFNHQKRGKNTLHFTTSGWPICSSLIFCSAQGANLIHRPHSMTCFQLKIPTRSVPAFSILRFQLTVPNLCFSFVFVLTTQISSTSMLPVSFYGVLKVHV